MLNLDLLILQEQGCRFCRIDYAQKGPTYKNWQISPYLVEQIPATGNVGVLTGEHSNGLLAVDFDGAWAWDEWERKVPYNLELLNTVTWTSWRPGRAQMGFMVPQEAWPLISTFKLTGPVDYSGKNQQLEFRWNGVQSVLPPSMHPDTHKPYEWVIAPSTVLIQELPLEVLEWMVSYAPPIETDDEGIEPVTIENLTVTQLDECERVLKKIKQHEPTLGYDDWSRVTWATVSHVGTEAGLVLMRHFWPEQSTGEYKKLLQGFNLQRSPKFGSLVHRATKHNAPTTTKSTIKKAFSGYQTHKLF